MLQTEYQSLIQDQETIRKNLAALGTSEREVSLRNQLLDTLEASEQRRRTLLHELWTLGIQDKEREQRQQALIDGLCSPAS